MADISAIKLPNNTTLTLKDATALQEVEFANHSLVTTTRSGETETVDIGTFDTLSATDLNAGNLLVTGGANFINGASGITHDDLEPITTATYTGILGTASNDAANDSFYFMKVRPKDFYCHWVIRYRITGTVPSNTSYTATSDVMFYGYGQAVAPAQYIFNNIYSTSYRPYYFHNFYRLTPAGYNAGYSNAIGIGLRASNARNTTGYERTIKVEVLETVNCTAELLGTPVKWANWAGTGTTNYAGLSEYNGCDNGLQETGDSNTYDRRLLNSSQRVTAGANGIKAYSLIMRDSTDKWQSLTTTSGNNVTHTKNPTGFYPYTIYYYGNSAVSANTLTANGNYIYETIPLDLRYSTNCGATLTTMKSVYLVGTIQNGLFYLDDLWYTQTLPSTNDGKVYIYIGEAYSTAAINLSATHPIYYFDGYLKQYSGDAPYTFAGTTGGFTVTPKGSTTSQTVNISGFLPTTGGVVNGSITATDLSVGNIVATGTGRFASGVIGDVTGNASSATRINGTLGAVSDNANHNIWVSSTTSADGIPKYVSGVSVNSSTKKITATGFVGSLTGNADTATKFASPVNITVGNKTNAFDGSAAISFTDVLTDDVQYVENQQPYLIRQSGGDGVEVHNYEHDTIVGGSVAWNQLMPAIASGNGYSFYSAQTNYEFADGVVTCNRRDGNTSDIADITNDATLIPNGHKGLICFDANTVSTSVRVKIVAGSTVYSNDTLTANAFNHISCIYESTGYRIQIFSVSGFKVKNWMLIDLTQMFGTTIADYVYSLETATAGSGIAWLKKYGFFTKPYYPYDAGTVRSVQGLVSHDTVGFNQWDEEWEVGQIATNGGTITNTNSIRSKNFNRCVPNAVYKVTCKSATATGLYVVRIYFYDSEHNYIGNSGWFPYVGTTTAPDNAMYFKITTQSPGDASQYGNTYNNDICVNISNLSLNGTYEPYTLYSYALDNNVVLRGIPKLDSQNNLYYDGDVYESSGTVTRKYGIVDLGTISWVKGNALSSGNGYVYYITADTVLGFKSNGGIISTLNTHPGASSSWEALSVGEIYRANNYIVVALSATTVADAKTSLSGKALVYELATPTTASYSPYSPNQSVSPYGTEQYTVQSSNGVEIPVGHITRYYTNSGYKIHNLPDLGGNGDGDYLIQQVGDSMSLKPISDQLSSYLPLSGGTMTGGVTFLGNQSSAWNDKGIMFTKGSRMGENSSGELGIYSYGSRVIIRPNGSSTTQGLIIQDATVIPGGSSVTLGSSSNKWSNVYATDVTATNVSASSHVAVNSSNSGTTGGIALYSNSVTNYGIAMRQTSNGGTHGYVNGDWAIYSYMSGTSADNIKTRGWVFKNTFTPENVASISGAGNMVINGSLTVGGNAANTSGCRMEFDSTLNCVNWIFN